MIFTQRTVGAALVVLALVLLTTMVFVKRAADREGQFLCKLVDENPNMTMDQCPEHSSNASWFITGAFGIGFVLLGLGAFLFVPQRTDRPAERGPRPRAVDTSGFDEDERAVYALLTDGDGSRYQSDLIRESGFSKVKMTRVLDKLEARGVLERRRRGMTNILVLK